MNPLTDIKRRPPTAPPKDSMTEGRHSNKMSKTAERGPTIGAHRFAQAFHHKAQQIGLHRTPSPINDVGAQSAAQQRKTLNELIRAKKSLISRDDKDTVDGPNLVTHLPDVVVQSDHRRELPFRITHQAVLLFLDISGFTALCEKYSQAAKTGTEQLTKTLNGYMSALVSEIISYDGDILKFAGDAILSMWPVDSLKSMQVAVENVIQCALDIQRKHGTYTTNDGVILKVKVGIAAGEIQILIVGNDEERTYIEVGRGIEDVNKAENMCEKGGDVVIAPGAWIHCSKLSKVSNYVNMHDTKFIKVLQLDERTGLDYQKERTIAVTADMENLERSIRNLIIPSGMILQQGSSKSVIESTLAGSSLQDSVVEHSEEQKLEDLIEIDGNMRRLRKTIITRFSHDKVSNLKLFISKPVLRKIEDGQPLEYLSEMRQVTMLFINLDVDRSTKYGYLIMMQRCYEVIHANTKRMRGCISKIFAFDKGCTFMVIFGLPGYKHENDSAHALSCAYGIYTELNRITGLKQTSIGVTTGPTYCGIVGHNHRHEYTVIGRRVNMGARLMMHYRGKVICDNTTFYFSKLNESYFIVQEAKEMKGLKQVGTVREFRPQVSLKDTMEQIRLHEEQKPIIGREDQLASFEQCLDWLMSADKEIHSQRAPVVMILGEIGMGRSRLLNAFMATALRRSATVILCSLAIGNVSCSYYVVKTLLAQLFKTESLGKEARVKHVREMFAGNNVVANNFDLLDALLDTQVEADRDTEIPPLNNVEKIIRSVVKHFAERCTALIFAVDDTHLMDDYSWRCMRLFGEQGNTLLLLTQRILLDQDITNDIAVGFMKDPKNRMVRCSGLGVLHLASIACQFLDVFRIPESLDHVLRLNSMGIPSWIDLLLREYLYESVIKIEHTLLFNHTETMVAPAPRDLVEHAPQRTADDRTQFVDEAAGLDDADFIKELKMNTVSPNTEQVCFMLIQQTDDLKVPASISSMIQARIDHMKEVDQTVLKSASIIGHFVFREILDHMLQAEMNKVDIAESVQRLADSGSFACASSVKKSLGRADTATQGDAVAGNNICTCRGVKDEKPMRECRLLMFRSASLRLTSYEMMLEQNRRPLHMAAAHFLEEKIRRLSTGHRGMNENSLYESYINDDDEEDKLSEDSPRESDQRGSDENMIESGANEKCSDEGNCSGSDKDNNARGSITKTSKAQSRRVSPLKQPSPNPQRLKTIIGAEGTMHHGETSMLLSTYIGKQGADYRRTSSKAKEHQQSTAFSSMNAANISDSVIVNYTGYERLGVLRIQYPQIAEQYRGAGNTQNTVFYLTEAAAACIALFDHSGAITHLREVNRILRDLNRHRNPFEGRVANLDNWKPESFDEGQMESLIGQTLFGMGKTKKAIPHFRLALKLFGCEQVNTVMQKKMATALEQALHLKSRHPASTREARLLVNQAQCLYYIFEDSIARDDLVGARYAATQQITKTERAGDLLGQIEAATCMMKLSNLSDDLSGIREYETKAKIKCVVAMQNVRNDQVIRLTRLYWTAFEIHLARSPVTEAVESGLAASRLMMVVRGTTMQLQMLASLTKSLIYSDRIKEAVDILDIMQNSSGTESRCWYFCGCVHFVLNLGVRVALVEDILSYSDEVLGQRMFHKRPKLLFAFACSLCVYYKRVRSEDRFEEWRKVAAKNEPPRYDSFMAAVGFFQLLECKLLELSRLIGETKRALSNIPRGSMRRRSIVAINQADTRYLEHVIASNFSFAEKLVRRLFALEPRYLILRAYYYAIRDRMTQARDTLQHTIRRSEALFNHSHSRWARHNHEAWFGEKISTEAVGGEGGGEKEDDGGAKEIDDAVAGMRPSVAANTIFDARISRRRQSGFRRSSSVDMRRGSTQIFHRGSVESTDPKKRQSSAKSQRHSLASWLHERGLSQTIADDAAKTQNVHDQWLKSANSAFPYWYIINHVRNETRKLLHFTLPLPEWFAVHWF